jgi:hypothetical protein
VAREPPIGSIRRPQNPMACATFRRLR